MNLQLVLLIKRKDRQRHRQWHLAFSSVGDSETRITRTIIRRTYSSRGDCYQARDFSAFCAAPVLYATKGIGFAGVPHEIQSYRFMNAPRSLRVFW